MVGTKVVSVRVRVRVWVRVMHVQWWSVGLVRIRVRVTRQGVMSSMTSSL